MTSASTPPSTASRVRRTMKELFVALAVTVAAILAMEGCASALLLARELSAASAPDPLRRPGTVADTLLGWRNEPNAVRADFYGKGVSLRTNALGHRLTSSEAAPTAPAKTVVCSGDSYTIGFGVADEQTWCALLQRAAPGVNTINMGHDSYGLDQTYLLFRRDAAAAPHSIQILAVTNAALDRAVSNAYLGWPKPTLAVRDGKLVSEHVPVPTLSAGEHRRWAMARQFDDVRTMQFVRDFAPFDAGLKRSQRVDEMRPVFERLVAELQAAHQAARTRLLIVYIPTSPDLRGLDERRAWLGGVARQQGVPFVDLTPAIRAVPKDSLDVMFFARWSPVQPPGSVGQLSKVGHMWVARMLSPHIGALVSATGSAGTSTRR